MKQRFKNALDMQMGAGNLVALSRVFAEACKEAMADTQSTKGVWEDPAIRLMVHQFAHLCQVDAINDSCTLYGELTQACESAQAAEMRARQEGIF